MKELSNMFVYKFPLKKTNKEYFREKQVPED